MSVEGKVKEILLDILDIEDEEIVPEASLVNDLSASSVDLVEVVAALENEFDIDISDEDAATIRTVKSICDYLQEHVDK